MGRQVPAEVYGTEVPSQLAGRLWRWHVTPAELDAMIAVVGHHWPAIEAHVRAHLEGRRYQPCGALPGRLCSRWCPVGGDPTFVAALRADEAARGRVTGALEPDHG